jgi:hypothetical protein
MSTQHEELQRIVKRLSDEGANQFLDRNRNLLALTKERISAALTLDRKLQEEVEFYFDVVTQKGPPGRIAREDCLKAIYQQILSCVPKGPRSRRGPLCYPSHSGG